MLTEPLLTFLRKTGNTPATGDSASDGRQPQATYCTNSAGKTTAFPRNSDEHPALNGETEITPSARLTD